LRGFIGRIDTIADRGRNLDLPGGALAIATGGDPAAVLFTLACNKNDEQEPGFVRVEEEEGELARSSGMTDTAAVAAKVTIDTGLVAI
jgi:hypothetical protein